MAAVSGLYWTAEYGEISERLQFRVGYNGASSSDAYFPISQLADLISVLTNVNSLSLDTLSLGSDLQARKANAGHRTDVVVEPRSDQFPPQIIRFSLDVLGDLISTLSGLQAVLGQLSPSDWDDSRPYAITYANLPDALSPEGLRSTIDARNAVNDYSNDVNKARRDVPVEHWYRNAFGPFPTYVQPQDRVEMPKGDDTPPSAPTGVTAVQEGSGVRVAWQASTDDTAVTGYTVHRGTTSGFTPATGNAIGTGTTLNRLDTPGVGTWYYKVTARDAAGNVSAPSNAASATVAPPAEFVPSEILSDWHTYVWAEQQTGSNGAVLATVTDGSGNGRTFGDFDTDTTRRPTLNTADAQLNGKKAIVFDGTNDVIKTDVFTAVGQPWSFAIIGYAANSGALAAFFDAENGTTSRGRHQRDTSNIHNIFAGSSVAGKAAEKFLITGEFNGTTSKFMVNGTEYAGSTGTAAAITRLYLGARRDGTWPAALHLAFFGDVARSFTSGETASLKARTAQTYGVAIS